jgi:hypothetical protein
MVAALSADHLIAQASELARDAQVEQLVTQLDDQPTQDRGINRCL